MSKSALPLVSLAESESPPATFDDYADAKFDGYKVELSISEFREKHESAWASLAIAIKLLEKDHRGMAEMVTSLESPRDDENMFSITMDELQSGIEYFRGAAESLESASMRLLAGASRILKERGERA